VGVFVCGLFCGAGIATVLFPFLSKRSARTIFQEEIRSSPRLRSECLAGKTVVAIEEIGANRLLLGTAGEGLWQFDPSAHKAKRVIDDLGRPTVGAITCILRGNEFTFAATFEGQEYWLKPNAVVAGPVAYAPYYACDGTSEEEYVVALWRGLAFWSARERQTPWFALRFKPALLETGITSVVFTGKNELAWSRADGGVFRGRLNEEKVVQCETLPSLPAGVNSLAWLATGRKLFATHLDRSFELDGGAWRPIPGRGNYPLKVVSCKHVVGQGCWVVSGGALGVLRSDGSTEWLFDDFPFIPVVAYADPRSGRIFVGTVGAGLVSFPMGPTGQTDADEK
jgi:hypothetical protein